MRLVINASEIGRRRGGNESYMLGLISGLELCASSHEVHLLTNTWDHNVPVPLPFEQTNLGTYKPLRFWATQQQRYVRHLQADWYVSNFFLPPDLPCKGAVIVHDMSFCAHPEYFPKHIALYMQFLTRWSARKADVIIAISEFTKNEIMHYWDVDPAKIVVIHNGIGDDFHQALDDVDANADLGALANYGVEPPFILTVGNIHPRKNLALLLDAYIELKQEGAHLPRLVWGGVKRWSVNELVKRAEKAGVILTGYIDQIDLPAFYRQAKVFVYPSLYEGFGLPPVEAMACGAPVVTSNNSSIPEVVGDAALLIDPTSKQDMMKALKRILQDDILREQLRSSGIKLAARYTWNDTATHLLAELEKRM